MSGLAPWALPPSRCRIAGVHADDPDRGERLQARFSTDARKTPGMHGAEDTQAIDVRLEALESKSGPGQAMQEPHSRH